MFQMLLLAAQAGGLAANLWQQNRESRYDAMGTKIQQKELDLRMQQEQLASSQESLFNMERLRDTMATQRAIFAARGQSASQGSNYFVGQESVRAFNSDEEARKLSLGFNEYHNKATQALLGIGLAGRKAARSNKMIGKTLNTLSFNSLGGSGSGGKINEQLSTIFKSAYKGWSGLND